VGVGRDGTGGYRGRGGWRWLGEVLRRGRLYLLLLLLVLLVLVVVVVVVVMMSRVVLLQLLDWVVPMSGKLCCRVGGVRWRIVVMSAGGQGVGATTL